MTSLTNQKSDNPKVVAYRLFKEAEEMAHDLKLELDAALLALLIHRLDGQTEGITKVLDAILGTSILSPEENALADDWMIYPVQVMTAGTVVRGPSFAVPNGAEVLVRQRRHDTERTGYVSNTEGGVKSGLTRSELGNNDAFSVKASNLDKFWFDASADSTYFELIVERKVAL